MLALTQLLLLSQMDGNNTKVKIKVTVCLRAKYNFVQPKTVSFNKANMLPDLKQNDCYDVNNWIKFQRVPSADIVSCCKNNFPLNFSKVAVITVKVNFSENVRFTQSTALFSLLHFSNILHTFKLQRIYPAHTAEKHEFTQPSPHVK